MFQGDEVLHVHNGRNSHNVVLPYFCWHVLQESMCFSLMEITTTSMENKKSISSGGEENNM
jgi:hypothetical protein